MKPHHKHNPLRLTPEEYVAFIAVKHAEQAALRGMRDLADFDVLCQLSEDLCAADRLYHGACARARGRARDDQTMLHRSPAWHHR